MCLIKLWETLNFLSLLIYFCVLLYTSVIFDRFLFFLKVSHIFFPECISTSYLRHWSSEDWNSIPGNLLNCVLCYMYCKQNILRRVWSEIRREHPSCPQLSHWQLFVVSTKRCRVSNMGYRLRMRSRWVDIGGACFFRGGLWNETDVRSIKHAKKNQGQYPAILTEWLNIGLVNQECN